MRERVFLALAVGFSALAPKLAGQERIDELTPRALIDSTYAVRVALDAFVENLRRGRLEERHRGSAALAAAVSRLASTASARASSRPRATLGVLWDLQLDPVKFDAAEPDLLRVTAHCRLAADIEVGETVTLTFARRGERWDLVEHEGLVPRLLEIAARMDRKAAR